MTDAREQVIAGLEAAIRDPHCPLQYSPLLMQAQKLLRAISPPEPTEGLRAHKIMTSQEYRDLNLKGWHMVCRDYDGPRSVGIRYTGDQTGSMPLQQCADPTEADLLRAALECYSQEQKKLRDAMREIEELADDHADVDDGEPDDWMRVLVIARDHLHRPMVAEQETKS